MFKGYKYLKYVSLECGTPLLKKFTCIFSLLEFSTKPSVQDIPFRFHNVYSENIYPLRGSNPDKGEVFCTHPDFSLGPFSVLYNEYRVSPPGVKRPERGVDHPHHQVPRSKKE
jgi:hypothetical protein